MNHAPDSTNITGLINGGVDADHEVMRMGEHVPPMFAFRDPDGNRLVLVERS